MFLKNIHVSVLTKSELASVFSKCKPWILQYYVDNLREPLYILYHAWINWFWRVSVKMSSEFKVTWMNSYIRYTIQISNVIKTNSRTISRTFFYFLKMANIQMLAENVLLGKCKRSAWQLNLKVIAKIYCFPK